MHGGQADRLAVYPQANAKTQKAGRSTRLPLVISFIEAPVLQLNPDLSEEEAMVCARTLFAAVQGIAAFSRQDRFIGLSSDNLEPEMVRFVDQMLAGVTD